MKRIITIIGLIFICSVTSNASATDLIRDEFPINETFTVDNQDHATVAMTQDGGFWATWHSYGSYDGDGTAVFARRFDETGQPLGTEFVVNTTTAADQLVADISTNRTDLFVITWCSGSSGTGYDVFAKIFSNTGAVLVDEFKVNNKTSIKRTWPDVAMNDAGDFIVIWDYVGQGQLTYYVKMFNSQGSPLTAQTRINRQLLQPITIAGAYGLPDIAFSNAGIAIATWERPSGVDGTDLEIVVRLFNPYIPRVGQEVLVDLPEPGFVQRRPMVDINEAGDALVTWIEYPKGYTNKGNVYVKKYFAASSRWGERINPDSNPEYQQHRSVAKLTESGHFVMAWSRYNSSDANDTYMRFYNPQGTPMSSQELINTTVADDQRRPALDFIENAGHISLTTIWESAGQDGDGWGVFGKFYQIP